MLFSGFLFNAKLNTKTTKNTKFFFVNFVPFVFQK